MSTPHQAKSRGTVNNMAASLIRHGGEMEATCLAPCTLSLTRREWAKARHRLGCDKGKNPDSLSLVIRVPTLMIKMEGEDWDGGRGLRKTAVVGDTFILRCSLKPCLYLPSVAGLSV